MSSIPADTITHLPTQDDTAIESAKPSANPIANESHVLTCHLLCLDPELVEAARAEMDANGTLHITDHANFRKKLTDKLLNFSFPKITMDVKRDSNDRPVPFFPTQAIIRDVGQPSTWHTGRCLTFTDGATGRALSGCLRTRDSITYRPEVVLHGMRITSSNNLSGPTQGYEKMTGTLRFLSVNHEPKAALWDTGTLTLAKMVSEADSTTRWWNEALSVERMQFWFGHGEGPDEVTRGWTGDVSVALRFKFVDSTAPVTEGSSGSAAVRAEAGALDAGQDAGTATTDA